MKVHSKTHRRLVLVIAGLVVLSLLGGGAYVARKYQLRSRALAARPVGMEAAKAGDWPKALDQLGRYLGHFPSDAEALYQYARARQEVVDRDGKHIGQAIGLYKRVVDLDPKNLEARYRLLDLFSQLRYVTETITVADGILKEKPGDLKAMREKALALATLRRFSEALPLAAECNKLAPLDLRTQILTLDLMRQANQAPKAIVDHASSLLAAHPNDARFELLQSIAYWLTGDSDKAVEWARKAASRNLVEAEFINALVEQLDELKLLSDSFKVLEDAAASSKLPLHQSALAARLIEMDRTKDVADRLSQLDANNSSSDSELLALRALALLRQNRAAEAAPIVDALSQRAADVRARAWSGVLKVLLQQEKASARDLLAACREASAMLPANAFFSFYMGDAYLRLGETELGLQQMRLAAVKAPAWAEPLVRMANTLATLSRLQEAFDASIVAYQRSPKDPAVLTTIAAIWTAGLLGGTAEPPAKLTEILGDIQAVAPDDERLVPIQVALAARQDKAKAAALLTAALQTRADLSDRILLNLVGISRRFQLNLEQACFDRSEKLHGPTPELIFTKAQTLSAADKPQEGLALFNAAKPAGAEVDWALARARYIELIDDASAKAGWAALGAKYPDNTAVQRAVLGAKSVQTDRELVATTIERLKAQVGEQGAFWRYARAGWLLGGNPSEKELAEAITLLGDVTRAAPDWVAPRVLLAGGLEKSGDLRSASNELRTAAALEPNTPAITLDLARLIQLQGDFEQVRQLVDQVAKSPQCTGADRRRAASLLTQQGDAERALALMQQGGAGEGQSPDLLMAALYAQRNELAKAEAIAKTLLEKPDPAIIRFAAGLYQSMGRNAEAEAVLAKLDAIQVRPGVKELVRAEFYQRAGKADIALKHFQDAVKADPKNISAARRLIAHLLLMNRGKDALAVADQALGANPGQTAFDAFRRQGKFVEAAATDGALRILLLALIQQDEDVAAAVESLEALGVSPQRGEAELTRLRQVADRYPRFLAVQNVLARMYLAAGRAEDALTISSRAIPAYPTASEPPEIAATALASLRRWPQVISVAEEWRKRAQANPLPADLLIANARLASRDPAAAAQQLEPYMQAAKAAPDRYTNVLVVYAQALADQRKIASAADLLSPLLPASAPLRAAWIQIAANVVAQADPAVAAQWLQTVEGRIPPAALDELAMLTQGWRNLADRTKDAQHQAKAKQLLADTTQKFLSSDKASAQGLVVLALIQEGGGDLAMAERLYRNALQRDPNSIIAQNNLAVVITNRGGDLREALALAKKATSVNHAGLANALETLASIQAKLNDYPGAIQSLQTALRSRSGSLDVNTELGWRIELAFFYNESGQSSKARAALDEIERLRPDSADIKPEARKLLQSLRQSLTGGAKPN